MNRYAALVVAMILCGTVSLGTACDHGVYDDEGNLLRPMTSEAAQLVSAEINQYIHVVTYDGCFMCIKRYQKVGADMYKLIRRACNPVLCLDSENLASVLADTTIMGVELLEDTGGNHE